MKSRLSKFTYRDNRNGAKVIFEVTANDILLADEFLEANTKFKAIACPFIGVTVEPVKE